MQEKYLEIYYGQDRLPYKDKEHAVHYPVCGGVITGENNTTHIRLFVGELGNPQEMSFMASIKKPDDTKVGRLLNDTLAYDEEKGYYVVLSLEDLYLDQVGKIKIGLHCYYGNVVITGEDDEYQIHGTPSIIALGEIAIMVNYTPNIIPTVSYEPTVLQQILAYLSHTLNIENGILVAESLGDLDQDELVVGQIVFDKETKIFYKWNGLTFEEQTSEIRSLSIMALFPTRSINGRDLSNWSAVWNEGELAFTLKRLGQNPTESQAKLWLSATTGSDTLPVFNIDKPQAEYLMFVAPTNYGTLIKQNDIVFGKIQWNASDSALKVYLVKAIHESYSKTESDNKFATIEDLADLIANYNTKQEITTLLNNKENLQKATRYETTGGGAQVDIPSKTDYTFTNPLASLTITSLTVSTGDNMPIWTFVFECGANFTLTFPSGIVVKWLGGNPIFTQGKIYQVAIKKGTTNNEYLATLGEF